METDDDKGKKPERRSLAEEQRDPTVEIPETVSVDLKAPFAKVAGGGELVKRVTFRTPSWIEIKKLRRVSDSQSEIAAMDAALVLLNIDDLTQPDFDRMKAIDAQRCWEAIVPFASLEKA